jgi:hypothetical protein
MPHWGGRGESVQRQLWHVVLITTTVVHVLVVVSRVFVSGLFVVAGGERWRMFAFGWLLLLGRRGG